MTIIRISKRETPYLIVDKTFLDDDRLSYKAKGILAYLLSKPDNWIIMLKDLAAKGQEGRCACASAIHELEAVGYVERKKTKAEKGHFDGWETIVYERPRSGYPTSDNLSPRSGYPKSDNLTLISNDINNKNKATVVALQKENGKQQEWENFMPSQTHFDYAEKHKTPSPDLEIEKFRNYHISRGSYLTIKNKDRAFYNWLLNAKEYKEIKYASSRRNIETSRRRSKVDIFEAATAGAFDPDS